MDLLIAVYGTVKCSKAFQLNEINILVDMYSIEVLCQHLEGTQLILTKYSKIVLKIPKRFSKLS